MPDVNTVLDPLYTHPERPKIPVRWSASRIEGLRDLASGTATLRSPIDAELASAALLCVEGHFDSAARQITRLIKNHPDLVQRDNETFISAIFALYMAQQYRLLAAMLREKFGFDGDFSIDVEEDGPGVGRISWEITTDGVHRFVFDEESYQYDKSRNDVLGFYWAFPMYANYSQSAHKEHGRVIINQLDIGFTPGLAWCDNRPDYFLVPDCIFIPTKGYAYEREILTKNLLSWEEKQELAFWRGGTTGIPSAPNDWRSLERVHLCEIARRHEHLGFLDIGLSSILQIPDPHAVEEIKNSGLMKGFVAWEKWGEYKYLVDIDGNSSPWSNLFQRLLTGSVVLKVESSRALNQWFYGELRPWVNYIPIAPDISDLIDKIQWLRRNDAFARSVGEAGRALALDLTYERELEKSSTTIARCFRYFRQQQNAEAGPFGRGFSGATNNSEYKIEGARTLAVLLAQKQKLENAAEGCAPDSRTSGEYLTTLHAIDRMSVGTLSFRWHGHPHPLYFRCGTSDLSNFEQIFLNKEYEVSLPHAPRRIFDLGGYVGYAAAYLASKYPSAAIVSVEPSIDNFRINALNTGLFSNVRRLNAAVWESTGSLTATSSLGGDWGAIFSKGPSAADDVPCYTLDDLMAWAGWDSFDFLKCDIEGAEREVFRQARERIAANVNVCAVEVHEMSTPGAEAAVYGCFDQDTFDRFKQGEFHYFSRRDVGRGTVELPRVMVLKPAYGLRGIELINVPEQPWGYYIFQGDSCQLHPGDVHAHPAILRARVELAGQTNFNSELSVWNPLGFAVKFSAELASSGVPRRIFAVDAVVKAGERQELRLKTEPLNGEFELTLSTQMADGVPTNHQASANWHHPSFF